MEGRRLKRAIRAAIIPLVAGTLLAVAQPASSVPTVPGGTSFTIIYPPNSEPGGVCDFPVQLSGCSAQKERVTLPNRLVVVTGPGVLTVTNMHTPKSLTYNISGPSLLDQTTGTATFFVTNVIIGPEGHVTGEPFLMYTAGKVTVTPEQPLAEPVTGTVLEDICAALAR